MDANSSLRFSEFDSSRTAFDRAYADSIDRWQENERLRSTGANASGGFNCPF